MDAEKLDVALIRLSARKTGAMVMPQLYTTGVAAPPKRGPA